MFAYAHAYAKATADATADASVDVSVDATSFVATSLVRGSFEIWFPSRGVTTNHHELSMLAQIMGYTYYVKAMF